MRALSTLLALSFLFACGGTATDRAEPSWRPSGIEVDKDGEPPDGTTDSVETAEPVDTAGCGALTRTDCMKSPDCTLASAGAPSSRDSKYVCRPARGSCEADLSQFDLPGGGTDALRTPEAAKVAERVCTDRPGCAVDAGDCYCACKGYGKTSIEDGPEAAGCLCYCAGGAPPTCRHT